MTEEEMKKRLEALEADLAKANEEKKLALGEKFKAAQELKAAKEAAENAVEEAAAKGGDELSKLKREVAKFQKDAEANAARAEQAEKGLQTFRAESAIANAIASNNVDSKHVRAVTALLKMDLQYGEDGTPNIDGKAVEDYAKSYFSKDGLSYVRASDNGGGAAQGNDGASANSYAGKPFNLGEYAALKASNPTAAAAWANETKNGYLNDLS